MLCADPSAPLWMDVYFPLGSIYCAWLSCRFCLHYIALFAVAYPYLREGSWCQLLFTCRILPEPAFITWIRIWVRQARIRDDVFITKLIWIGLRLVIYCFGIGSHFIFLLFADKVHECLPWYILNCAHVVLFVSRTFKIHHLFTSFIT